MRWPCVPSLVLFCCMALLFCPGVAHAQDDLADVVARAEQCVVRIDVENVGQGSGYVVASSGIVVTNVHVMAGAERAIATFPNGNKHEIRGTYWIDEGRDICIIQIEATGLAELPVATDLPRKGEEVIALGSPLGLSFSATRGIVSAIRKEAEIQADISDPTMRGTWVQVDAPLSPGNSGGPLINKAGQLVAMSTRASSGRAQNLNFGISAIDVSTAIKSAKGKPLQSLAETVGKIDMGEVHPESGEMVERTPIPESALQQYVERGKAEYSELAKDFRRAATRAEEICREMRSGKTYSPDPQADVVRVISRSKTEWYFRTESIKKREVSRQQARSSEMKRLREVIGTKPDNDSLFAVLWNFGPRLDARDKGKIGFMADAIVLRAFTEHDVIVLYDDVPYMMWVKDSSGLSPGQEMTPAPVFVVGSQTMEIPGRGPVAVTILNAVLESELRKAIFGDESAAVAGSSGVDKSALRTWRASSGSYTVEAALVDSDATKVVLKKADGTIITVERSKLSAADNEFLDN